MCYYIYCKENNVVVKSPQYIDNMRIQMDIGHQTFSLNNIKPDNL